tara:strand:- start:3650 stop:6190 length:2541 start_codon:yes stop_codon:yes gene_type:complete
MEPNLDSLVNFMANEPSSKLTGTKRDRDDEVTMLDYNSLSMNEKKEVIIAELNMIVLTEITNFIKTLEIDKNKYSSRQINTYIQNLISMKEAQCYILHKAETDFTFRTMVSKEMKDEYTKKSTIAMLKIGIDILKDLKLNNYTKGFNINTFLNEMMEEQTLIFLNYLLPETKNKKARFTKTISEDELNNVFFDEKDYDEEYIPELGYEEEEEEESEYESSDDEVDVKELHKKRDTVIKKSDGKQINKTFRQELEKMNQTNLDVIEETLEYYCNIDEKKRRQYLDKLKNITILNKTTEPYIISLLDKNIDNNTKSHIISTIHSSANSRDNKLKNWVRNVIKLPLGKNIGMNMADLDTSSKKKDFLVQLKHKMDSAVFGHNDAKRHIVQVMAQNITNPKSKGSVMGLWGPPGNGKTSLIKEGIAKAMGRPFNFISLGGATDASFMEGHDYTYEGSMYGRIVSALIDSKCMNPIIYFDELDKISKTPKGDEIVNLLVHLIDPVQNCFFKDKYFHGINFDLSQCTFIFSFNNPHLVDSILMDRITRIETKYLTRNQKLHIGSNYLTPSILKEMNIPIENINFSKKLVEKLIDEYTREGGVRGLRKLMYHLVREVNLAEITEDKLNSQIVKYPFKLTKDNTINILKEFRSVEKTEVHDMDKVGLINGMWAGSLGLGGILPIECIFIPSKIPLSIKATGSLEKVIKESTEVACSVAWSKLSTRQKNKLNKKWTQFCEGIHIHCPEGAVPKDGPSAGTALTIALYSLFTNKTIPYNIAITGEINLQGDVMTIGGLEEKLQGAKKAGVVKAYIPRGNEKDLYKIRQRVPTLFNNFDVEIVDHVDDVMNNVFRKC